jgi:predicted permease
MATIAPRIARLTPGEDSTLAPVPLQGIVTEDVDRALLVLLGAVGFVLLLACANVAHLQLVRAASRSREVALRTALGGTRARLVQQSLIESAVLAIAGAIGGVGLAWVGVRALVLLAPSGLPRLDAITVDGRVLAFVLAVTAISALAFGLTPALTSTRASLGTTLRDGARGSATGGRRTRSALVISEFAAALVLLAGAGLMMRSFGALLAVDAGYDRQNLLSMVVSVHGTSHAAPGRRDAFFHDLVERTRALPGVQAVSATNHLPLHGDHWHFGFSIEGRPYDPAADRPSALFRVVRTGYFPTMRIGVVAGRDFTPTDAADGSHVVIVNQSMARRHWPDGSPLGQRLTIDDPTKGPTWHTVVGVVADVRQESWDAPSGEEMYFPSISSAAAPAPDDGTPKAGNLFEPQTMTLVVRTAGDPASLTRAVQRVVHELDADAPVSDVITMAKAVDEQLAQPRFYLMLFGAFAGIALALAGVGVYGVMSYAAAQRAREMGIRVALGAGPTDPFRLVLRDGMRLAAVGSAIGLGAALVGSRAMRSLLYGVGPTDPVTLVAVTAVLVGVALAACCVPAWRAARIDPASTLRAD